MKLGLSTYTYTWAFGVELWTPPEADLESTIVKEQTWADQSLQYLRSTGKFTFLNKNPNQL